MFLLGVVMGTGSTITVKVMYGLQAVGESGGVQRFEKPLFTTWVMFIAMTIALPAHYAVEAYRTHRRSRRSGGEVAYARLKGGAGGGGGGEDASGGPVSVPWRTFVLLVIPAAFDLLGTALASIGLLFTTVSVYQLVRCSVIIVTAVLKATVLKQQLTHYMWCGILVNTLAMVLVSSSSLLPGASAGASVEEDGIDRDPRVGIVFILLSCLVQGSQYVFEERVMTVDNAPPLVVVGMEGLWGALLMPIVVFPWAYILPGTDVGGCMENIYDSYVMVQRSSAIQLILVIFTLTVFFYNIFCIYVTFLLSSIWHAILDNFRPISVWVTDLALFYLFTQGAFGERWTTASWLELLGMILLFLGTAIYNGSVRLPGFSYEEVESIADADEDSSSEPPSAAARRESMDISSPMLTRSPLITRQMGRSPGSSSSSASSAHHGGAVSRDLSAEFGHPHLQANGPRRGGRAVHEDDEEEDGAKDDLPPMTYGSLGSASKVPHSSRATHSNSRPRDDRS